MSITPAAVSSLEECHMRACTMAINTSSIFGLLRLAPELTNWLMPSSRETTAPARAPDQIDGCSLVVCLVAVRRWFLRILCVPAPSSSGTRLVPSSPTAAQPSRRPLHSPPAVGRCTALLPAAAPPSRLPAAPTTAGRCIEWLTDRRETKRMSDSRTESQTACLVICTRK